MVSAAKGAEAFYRTDTHVTRHENLTFARTLDDYAAQVRLFCKYILIVATVNNNISHCSEQKVVVTFTAQLQLCVSISARSHIH